MSFYSPQRVDKPIDTLAEFEKEVIFCENECRQYKGTARLIFAKNKKKSGKSTFS